MYIGADTSSLYVEAKEAGLRVRDGDKGGFRLFYIVRDRTPSLV